MRKIILGKMKGKLTTFAIVFLFLSTISCSKDEIVLKAEISDAYSILYKKDTIFISLKSNQNKLSDSDTLVKLNDNYYFIEDGEKKLFFSTLSDTIYFDESEGDKYKVEITKLKNSKSFQTSYYLINHLDVQVILSTFYYDKNYRINKIQRGGTINYVP